MNKTITVIDENNYAEIMEKEVEPYLSSIRKDGKFISFDGKRIHYEAYIIENAKANIVISHGFTESAEKFREMVYYFVKSGYNAFSIDHRGHGESYRLPGDNETVRLNNFSDYVEDFNIFIDEVVKKSAPALPVYIYSHSMGGAVAARFIEEYPDKAQKAVLSSPMICADTGMPVPVTKALASAVCALGKSGASVPGMCKFDENKTYENSHDTSKARFDYYHAKRIKNPHLRTSGPSFGWVRTSMKMTDEALDENNINKISAEVLLLSAENDNRVLPEYQQKFAQKAGISLTVIPNTKHEIFMSENSVMESYLEKILDFFGENK